jgi:DNA-binding SARP family transcriptional activator
MTANNSQQSPDEQVYQQSKNNSEELPEDPTPEYDEMSEESFPASDPPATNAGVADATDIASSDQVGG